MSRSAHAGKPSRLLGAEPHDALEVRGVVGPDGARALVAEDLVEIDGALDTCATRPLESLPMVFALIVLTLWVVE